MLGGLGDRLRRVLFGPSVESFPAPPISFEDADGRSIDVRGFREGDRDALVAM